MNLSTIVYLGERQIGNGRTVLQLLQNMEDDNPSMWAWYIHRAIAIERQTGNIDQPDETQFIEERMNEIMRRAGKKEVFVGSLNNQQAGLVPPKELINYIFKRNVELKSLWEWIRDHFLPVHKFDYDWFALLRYLADNNKLEKGISVKNTDFAKQMNEWFPSYNCTSKGVKLYRTGYLGDIPYRIWNRTAFSNQRRSGQALEGYDHLERILHCCLD